MKNLAFKLALLTIMTCFIVVTTVPRSHAKEEFDPWVSTYDTNDNPKEIFAFGETVRIKAYSDLPPFDIIVKDPFGVTVWSDTSPTKSYTKDVTGITTPGKPGWWMIMAGSTETFYAIAWYYVIPEAPLGVIAVFLACFAGLGVHRIRQKKTEA